MEKMRLRLPIEKGAIRKSPQFILKFDNIKDKQKILNFHRKETNYIQNDNVFSILSLIA